jgi:hypothetical protein
VGIPRWLPSRTRGGWLLAYSWSPWWSHRDSDSIPGLFPSYKSYWSSSIFLGKLGLLYIIIYNKSQRNQSEAARRKKRTVITKAYKYGKLPGVYVTLLIYYNGRYTTYRSKRNRPLLIEEIVSRILSMTERIKANPAPNQSTSTRHRCRASSTIFKEKPSNNFVVGEEWAIWVWRCGATGYRVWRLKRVDRKNDNFASLVVI